VSSLTAFAVGTAPAETSAETGDFRWARKRVALAHVDRTRAAGASQREPALPAMKTPERSVLGRSRERSVTTPLSSWFVSTGLEETPWRLSFGSVAAYSIPLVCLGLLSGGGPSWRESEANDCSYVSPYSGRHSGVSLCAFHTVSGNHRNGGLPDTESLDDVGTGERYHLSLRGFQKLPSHHYIACRKTTPLITP